MTKSTKPSAQKAKRATSKNTAVRMPISKKPEIKKSSAKTKLVAKFPDPSIRAQVLAKMALRPSTNAAAVIHAYSNPLGEQSIGALAECLSESMTRVQEGDMKQCEAMLVGQAQALQTIFMNFSRRTLSQDYQANLESFFKMAMKAQNQCRMTLETLAAIKNPPVVFARQANINQGNGNQQVNNGTSAPAPRAQEEKTIPSNELLEDQHGERLDTRTTRAASSSDKELAAVGKSDGPKDGHR